MDYLDNSPQFPRSSQEWRPSLTTSQTPENTSFGFSSLVPARPLPGSLTLFTEMGICMMKITPAGLRFYCAWQGARKKRLHSQLLEFLNTNNILWDQWAGAGPPHPARLLRPQTSSDCAAGKRASPGVGGGGSADGQGSRRGQVQRGARRPGRPAGRERRRGREPGWGALGAPAHLERRAWKRLAREGAPSASFPARRPPAGPGPRPAPLAWPWPPRRLRKAGFPEWPEGGGESARRPWNHPSPSLSRPSRAGALEADSGAAGRGRRGQCRSRGTAKGTGYPHGPAGIPIPARPETSGPGHGARSWPSWPARTPRPGSGSPESGRPPPPRAQPQHAQG